ncbi:sperm motility kinase 2B-like isoform X2 [Ptychodera flava]
MKRIQLITLIEGLLAKGNQLTYFSPNDVLLKDRLSTGGQSIVWEATVNINGEEKDAVVKVVKDDEELEYAVHEVELLCECQDVLDCVVKILGMTVVTDEVENHKRTYRLGLVLEKGDHDLSTHLNNNSSYSAVTLLEIFCSIVEKVYALHKHGIAHRDLKLENILVQGEDLKIVDLGLATKTEKYYEAEWHIICGTKGYDAPEICLGEMDGEAIYEPKSVDFFSLGVMLFSMLLDRTKHDTKKCQKAISQATKRLNCDTVIERCVQGKLICGDHEHILDIIRDLIEPDPCRRLTNARVLLNRVQKVLKEFKTGVSVEGDSNVVCQSISARRRSGKENDVALKPLKATVENKYTRPKRLQERNRSPRSPRTPKSPRGSGRVMRKFIFQEHIDTWKRRGRSLSKDHWG